MSVGDFILLHGQGLIGMAILVIVILATSAFGLKKLKDPEGLMMIRWVRNILLFVIVAGYGVSLLVSANVSLNHTTIDRSAGDQEQRALDQRLQNQGERR